MEPMNKKIVEANIKLQDKNKILEEDKKILQKRIDIATNYMKENARIEFTEFYKTLLDMLEGRYVSE